MLRLPRCLSAAWFAVAGFAVFVSHGWPDCGAELDKSPLPPLTVSDLVDTSPRQNRWMTLPFSRVVVNPCDFWIPTVPVTHPTDVALPFNVGYYAGGDAVRLDNLWTLYQQTGSTSSGVAVRELGMKPGDWLLDENVTAEQTTHGLKLTAPRGAPQCATCGAISQDVLATVTADTWIRVTVPDIEAAWSLKVADAESSAEITLQRDIVTTGTFHYNLGVLTGWRGEHRVRVRFYAATLKHAVTLAQCGIVQVKGAALRAAQSCVTSWAPHELVTTATYADNSRAVSRDRFYDENTAVRSVDVQRGGSKAQFMMAGEYRGNIKWDASARCLSVTATTCTYSICFDRAAELGRPEYYRDVVDLVSKRNAVMHAPSSGMWAIPVENFGAHVMCSFAFGTLNESANAVAARAQQPFTAGDANGRAVRQRHNWDEYLASVPRLSNFDLVGLDPHGVTCADVRRCYYDAWVFLEANILPVMPETGFAYPQVPAGKMSLWSEGHPRARPTASWDSLFAMQLEAYVRPDVAWDAFAGLMSLVDETGALGGESLPSRKAQTARILYEQTSDSKRLREIYPALKRHLLWAEQNPRWIFKKHNHVNEKDADFVVSLLVDFGHAAHLAQVLGIPADVKLWDEHRREFYSNYEKWFWPTPESEPIEILHTITGKTNPGNTLWVSAGLALDELTSGPRLAGLLRRLRNEWRPERPFLGLVMPKYPEVSLLMHGLLTRGMYTEAGLLANVCVRDVTQANMFAEQYSTWEFPTPDGVRPSAFGAAMLVDMLWMKNGYRMDRMGSARVELPGECGGKFLGHN